MPVYQINSRTILFAVIYQWYHYVLRAGPIMEQGCSADVTRNPPRVALQISRYYLINNSCAFLPSQARKLRRFSIIDQPLLGLCGRLLENLNITTHARSWYAQRARLVLTLRMCDAFYSWLVWASNKHRVTFGALRRTLIVQPVKACFPNRISAESAITAALGGQASASHIPKSRRAKIAELPIA